MLMIPLHQVETSRKLCEYLKSRLVQLTSLVATSEEWQSKLCTADEKRATAMGKLQAELASLQGWQHRK